MSTKMSPEIAARYRKVIEWWRKEEPRLPPPLQFEVPPNGIVRIAAEAYIGAYIDEKRFYAENRGGARNKLILLYTIAGVFSAGFLLLTLLRPTGVIFLLPNWMMTLLLPALAYWAWRAEKRVTREATIVFERETGKVYVPVDDNTPHVVLDFYDQYFYVTGGHAGINRFGALYLYLPKVKLEEGRELGGFPMRLAVVGSEEEALIIWNFLVRYMDKSWPFTDDEHRYFEHAAMEKEQDGFKVEDIRRVPGERTFF